MIIPLLLIVKLIVSICLNTPRFIYAKEDENDEYPASIALAVHAIECVVEGD